MLSITPREQCDGSPCTSHSHECNQQDDAGVGEDGALADLVPGLAQAPQDEGGHAAAGQAEDGDEDAPLLEAGDAEERGQLR